MITWLKNNVEPVETITEYWKKTASYRLNQFSKSQDCDISQFIENWPRYKDANGYQLVN